MGENGGKRLSSRAATQTKSSPRVWKEKEREIAENTPLGKMAPLCTSN
ncbi:hypothetical protein PITC_036630 [Penicillium italicum]|uniref:Uncharacterized protein n=1 Tax=Penicillium italicum TaxID=40296 RepID=A0A0A2L827_PENIT|nr:hypothetical protein PITC_036630 [Penicillium italicum]